MQRWLVKTAQSVSVLIVKMKKTSCLFHGIPNVPATADKHCWFYFTILADDGKSCQRKEGGKRGTQKIERGVWRRNTHMHDKHKGVDSGVT
jgi:hypothetical protein